MRLSGRREITDSWISTSETRLWMACSASMISSTEESHMTTIMLERPVMEETTRVRGSFASASAASSCR